MKRMKDFSVVQTKKNIACFGGKREEEIIFKGLCFTTSLAGTKKNNNLTFFINLHFVLF